MRHIIRCYFIGNFAKSLKIIFLSFEIDLITRICHLSRNFKVLLPIRILSSQKLLCRRIISELENFKSPEIEKVEKISLICTDNIYIICPYLLYSIFLINCFFIMNVKTIFIAAGSYAKIYEKSRRIIFSFQCFVLNFQ